MANTLETLKPNKKRWNSNDRDRSDDYEDRPTFYKNNEKDKPIRAGGVLFYYQDDGEPEILMIKNRGYYEDFGGKTEMVDRTIEDTIAREVEEESNSVFHRDEIRSYLSDRNTINAHNSKYLLYFVKLDKYCDTSVFGDREYHDGFDRTVEWIPYSQLMDKDFIKKSLHYRLRNKNFFDGLRRCVNLFF
jgi:ADP-ribose pyrophosphatase YjhB (NUDIX family)